MQPITGARCEGGNCPSKKNCRRFTERKAVMNSVPAAALWLRREAGASACDMVMFVTTVTTFKDEAAGV